jgi:hypothetical protein
MHLFQYVRSDVKRIKISHFVGEHFKKKFSQPLVHFKPSYNLQHVKNGKQLFLMSIAYALAGFDLTTHSSSLLGGRQRRYDTTT